MSTLTVKQSMQMNKNQGVKNLPCNICYGQMLILPSNIVHVGIGFHVSFIWQVNVSDPDNIFSRSHSNVKLLLIM